MQIKYNPQRSDDNIAHTINGDIITTTYQDKQYINDLSNIVDGEKRDFWAGEKSDNSLNSPPLIVSAEKKDGIIYVQLLCFIGADATEEEKYPEWHTA
jgi:hypothetical protein